MTNKIETIATARLRLRPHRLDDFNACAALWSDPSTTQFILEKPQTREEVWQRFLRYAGHWQMLGFGFFLIEEREGGASVGEVGMADFKRDMEPGFGDTPEMGWVMSEHARGKGYASEAVAALVAWADGRGMARTVCIIDPGNAPSLRVAEKCGYREYDRTMYHRKDVILFERFTP